MMSPGRRQSGLYSASASGDFPLSSYGTFAEASPHHSMMSPTINRSNLRNDTAAYQFASSRGADGAGFSPVMNYGETTMSSKGTKINDRLRNSFVSNEIGGNSPVSYGGGGGSRNMNSIGKSFNNPHMDGTIMQNMTGRGSTCHSSADMNSLGRSSVSDTAALQASKMQNGIGINSSTRLNLVESGNGFGVNAMSGESRMVNMVSNNSSGNDGMSMSQMSGGISMNQSGLGNGMMPSGDGMRKRNEMSCPLGTNRILQNDTGSGGTMDTMSDASSYLSNGSGRRLGDFLPNGGGMNSSNSMQHQMSGGCVGSDFTDINQLEKLMHSGGEMTSTNANSSGWNGVPSAVAAKNLFPGMRCQTNGMKTGNTSLDSNFNGISREAGSRQLSGYHDG